MKNVYLWKKGNNDIKLKTFKKNSTNKIFQEKKLKKTKPIGFIAIAQLTYISVNPITLVPNGGKKGWKSEIEDPKKKLITVNPIKVKSNFPKMILV